MKVTIDRKNVQEDTLAEVIIALEHAVPGCAIEMQEIYNLEISNATVAAILQTLFGGNGYSETVPAGKATKAAREKKSRNDAQYEVMSGPFVGRQLKGAGLAKMIKTGKLYDGTKLRHPTKGNLVLIHDGQGGLRMVPA
jgi:hypothetical protein